MTLRRRTLAIALSLLAAVGAAFRMWHIATDPLWLDEAYSAFAAEHGLAFLWQVVPRYETHPPFYYTLLHGWVGLFGSSVPALRLPGLLAGLATPPILLFAAREAGRWLGWAADRLRRLELAAFGLGCVSSALVEMTHQVRPYPLMILTYSAACWCLLRIARRRTDGRMLTARLLAAYLLLLEAMLWLHNLGPLYGAALSLALIVAVDLRRLSRRDWLMLAGGHALVLLGYMPALAILRDQATAWEAHTWLRFAFDRAFVDHLAQFYAAPDWPGLAIVPLLALASAALLRVRNTGPRLLAMLLILTLLPVLLSVALSLTVAPVFITRTMTPVAAPALILLSLGAAAWSGKAGLLGAASVVLLGAGMALADVRARLAGPMQDWYRTVDWLAAHVQPGDQVLAYPNEGALPLGYALRDKHLTIPVRPIPTAVPSLNVPGGTYPNGTRGVVALPPDQLRAIADASQTRAVPTLWLLRLNASTYDPGDVFLTALRQDRMVVRSWRDGAIDIVGLRSRRAPGRSRR